MTAKENQHVMSAYNKYLENDVLFFNTVEDKCMPSDFKSDYHLHILCNEGRASFYFNGHQFNIQPHDLVIWQMSSEIEDVHYSDDFDADFLAVSKDYLGQFNPEMIWATKGFIFIKLNPVYHLQEEEWQVCKNDFESLKFRLHQNHIFRYDIIGRLLQILLFDMWNFYSKEIEQMRFGNNTALTFMRFLDEVGKNCKKQRDVAFYSDKLCITPKYLSEICRKVSNISASEWISYYTKHELVKMLNNTGLSLSEISDSMNFNNQSHFSRYTKKLLGVSPSEYRSEQTE